VLALASGCFNLVDHGNDGLVRLRQLALAAPAWRVASHGIDGTVDLVTDLVPVSVV
jgi:hypothetical protein